MFQIQEIVGEARKVCDINEDTGYNEDGLVVWHGRVAEWSKISSFVDEAYVQRPLPKSYGHRTVAIGSAARLGPAKENYYREYR